MALIYVDTCKCFLCNKSCVYCVINVNVDSYPGWLRLSWALKSIKLFRKFIHSILQSANNFIGNNLLSVMSCEIKIKKYVIFLHSLHFLYSVVFTVVFFLVQTCTWVWCTTAMKLRYVTLFLVSMYWNVWCIPVTLYTALKLYIYCLRQKLQWSWRLQ